MLMSGNLLEKFEWQLKRTFFNSIRHACVPIQFVEMDHSWAYLHVTFCMGCASILICSFVGRAHDTVIMLIQCAPLWMAIA